MSDDTVMGLMMAVLLVLAGLCVVGAIKSEKAWHAYADTHCKVIGEVSASTGVGTVIGSDGKVGMGTVYVPGKTGYRCDDGKDYWR